MPTSAQMTAPTKPVTKPGRTLTALGGAPETPNRAPSPHSRRLAAPLWHGTHDPDLSRPVSSEGPAHSEPCSSSSLRGFLPSHRAHGYSISIRSWSYEARAEKFKGDLACVMAFGMPLGTTSTWLSFGWYWYLHIVYNCIGQLSTCSPENCVRIWLLEDILTP